MAREREHSAGETLTEIQSVADSLAEWLRNNWILPAGIAAAVVIGTGVVAGVREYRESREVAASDALATVQREFLAQMGASPGAFDFEEPANPETGKNARREAADKLAKVGQDHAGTAAALLADVEAGALLAQAGNGGQAIEIWQRVVSSGNAGPELAALVQLRIGQAEESAGRWAEAAKAYQAAGEQRAFPLWPWALADAARAFVEAGDRPAATRIAERIQADAPDADLPPHLSALLSDLRAGASTPAS